MTTTERYHIFRDPVHGYVKVFDVEREIINSSPFQRLRHISQLGLSSYIYHAAEHSRFGHSIGVMNFATRIFDSLVSRYHSFLKDRLAWDDQAIKTNQQKLRVAALLHDIGHGPFSHASESLFPQSMDGKKQDHETYAGRIIQETEIGPLIDKYAPNTNVCSQDVINLISKKTLGVGDNFLKQILSSEMDADRMDYLLRDSLFTGVQYGKYDADRLIETMGVFQKQDGSLNIGIEDRGLHAVEGLLLARYFMFLQVYFHGLRRIYDIHLTHLIQEALQTEIASGEYPYDIAQYLEWDDIKVLAYAKTKLSTSQNAQRILRRTHFRVIHETTDHVQGGELIEHRKKLTNIINKVGREFVIEDESLKAPYIYDYKKGDEKLCVIQGKRFRDITLESKLVDALPEIFKLRIYVEPSHVAAALEIE